MSSELRRQNIADLLRRSAARYPNRVAIVCARTYWTYAQFSALCDRLAAGLAAVGIAPSDRVAVLARNSHAFAALRFAVARLGAVLVPVNFMLNAQEARYILQHSGARLLATDSELTSIAHSAVADTSIEQSLWLPSEQFSSPEPGMLNFNEIAQCDDAPLDVDVGSGDIAQIVYTSGTESLPKGVVLTHEAIIHQYVSCIVDGEMSSDDRVLHSLPLYHCAQLDWTICWR
jgi:fatty-acyl-CoA synthase